MLKLGIKRELIYRIRNEKVSESYFELESLLKINKRDMQTFKDIKLKQLISFSMEKIPYYREILQNIDSRTLKINDEFKSIPILNKKIIRERHDDLLCLGMVGSKRHTSGTTGEPLYFMKDRHSTAYMDAAMYLVYGWYGIKPTDRQARLWGSATTTGGKIFQKTKDYILDRRRLSAFMMNDNECRSYYRLLQKFKPKYFYCYPNALYQFALSIENQKISGKKLDIPLAICTGEVIFPYQRQKIEEVFGCRVIGEYGSTENGIIAFECHSGSLHVLPTVHLEIFEPDESGFGKIIVTEINSRSIAFIRYNIGDIGAIIEKKCDCGKQLPILQIKEGRIDTYIRCPNGKMVYDAILAYTLSPFVKQFKAYQRDLNLIDIFYVNDYALGQNEIDSILNTFIKFLGSQIKVKFYRINSISPEVSGKLRYFISELPK